MKRQLMAFSLLVLIGVVTVLFSLRGQSAPEPVALPNAPLVAVPEWTVAPAIADAQPFELPLNEPQSVDFAIDEALTQLKRLGLLDERGGLLSALPLPVAIERLETEWAQLLRPSAGSR